ncbi:MAG: hypothetical protein JOZ51_05340 [Chloroflexi bacterium]|nr:hypothetical protein [Chloroflexota bacterium]
MVFQSHRRSLGLKPTHPLVSALILGLTLSVTLFGQPAMAQIGNRPDLGDAPASNNNFGVGMQWFPGSPFNAQFPTVFFAGAQPTGPRHNNSPTVYFLGNSGAGGTITCENQADVGADCDGPNNINPPANTPNQDLGDDGPVWGTLGAINGCPTKTYTYYVTSLAAGTTTAYVNSWYDFNQSGFWGNTFACSSTVTVDEWIVKNQVITLAPGVNVFTTPPFPAAQNTSSNPRWVRISLSESPLPLASAAARRGSGPAQGWRLGETEDYRLPN